MRRVSLLLVLALAASAVVVVIAAPAYATDFTVNTLSDTQDIVVGDKVCADVNGKCSLRAAVMEINQLNRTSNNIKLPGNLGGPYVLSFGPPGDDRAASGDLDLRVPVNISPVTGTGTPVIQGGTDFGDRIFDIPSDTAPAVYIHDVTIQSGTAPLGENGGAIRDLGGSSLILQNMTISDSRADGGSGGALYVAGGAGSTLTVNGSSGLTLTRNTAAANGGGMDVEGATVADISTLTATGNMAREGGGFAAFLEAGGTGRMTGLRFSTLTGNQATGGGGGIAVARTELSHLTVSGNSAPSGGGIQIFGSTIPTVIEGRLDVNTNSATDGGGLYFSDCGAACTVVDVEADLNTASGNGSGIFVSGGLTIAGTTLYRNVTSGTGFAGGALYHTGPADQPMTVTNVTITENSGPSSLTNGVAIDSSAVDTITNATVAANTDGSYLALALTGAGVSPRVVNTALSNSLPTSPPNCNAILTSLGHNLDSGDTCGFHQGGDIVGRDPLLSSWADTGGFTKTMRENTGSPLRDAGDDSWCAQTDQRVVTRPQDSDFNGSSICDIGAYELSAWTLNSSIQISEAASPPSIVAPGSDVTYTLTLKNTGGDPLNPVDTTVVDDLPSSLTIQSCSLTGPIVGNCSLPLSNHQVILFPTFTHDPLVTETVTIIARVATTALSSSRIDNPVRVSSDNPDLWAWDNYATASIRVSVLPSISIGDASVLEGNSGATTASFPVTLSAPNPSDVTVIYSTANGTATAGKDYTAATSKVLTIPANQTTATIPITVTGDSGFEGNETFLVNLSSATGASIADSQAIGTIIDEEGAISFYVSDTQVIEGNSGQTTATFTVSLSAAPVAGQSVSVKVSTADGTAKKGTDYVAKPSTLLTFGAGVTSLPVGVTVNGDTQTEPNETFFLNLATPKGGVIADTKGMATIVNDDGTIVNALPALTVTDASVLEGDSGPATETFTVSLAPASTQTVTVSFSTADGTALSTSDYTAVPATTITFLPGETSKPMAVSVTGDLAHEGPETFLAKLASPTGATIADTQGTGTITDNESAITFSVGDAVLIEGNAGQAAMTFTIIASSAPVAGQAVSVKWATADGSATAGSDYTGVSLSLASFGTGLATVPVTVMITGDALAEGTESFVVNLSVPIGGSIADSQAVGSIIDDD